MKFFKYTALIMAAFSMVACDDTTDMIGSSITNNVDKLTVTDATYNVITNSLAAESVLSKTNNGIIGKVKDPETKAYLTADYMAQLAPLSSFDIDTLKYIKDANKGVLKAEGRHRLFVLILLPRRGLWHRLAVLVPAVAFGGNLVVAEIAAGVRIVNRCGGHRGDDLVLRGRRRAGTAHQLHPDGKTEQTGKLRLNFIEILVLDEIEFEFGVDGQGDEIGGKGLDLNVVEPEIDGGFGKRLPEGFLDQLPDLSDLFYVLKIGHAGKKTPFRQAENSAGLRARNKI